MALTSMTWPEELYSQAWPGRRSAQGNGESVLELQEDIEWEARGHDMWDIGQCSEQRDSPLPWAIWTAYGNIRTVDENLVYTNGKEGARRSVQTKDGITSEKMGDVLHAELLLPHSTNNMVRTHFIKHIHKTGKNPLPSGYHKFEQWIYHEYIRKRMEYRRKEQSIEQRKERNIKTQGSKRNERI